MSDEKERQRALARVLREKDPKRSRNSIADEVGVSPNTVKAWEDEDWAAQNSATEEEVVGLLLSTSQQILLHMPFGVDDMQKAANAVDRLLSKYLTFLGRETGEAGSGDTNITIDTGTAELISQYLKPKNDSESSGETHGS